MLTAAEKSELIRLLRENKQLRQFFDDFESDCFQRWAASTAQSQQEAAWHEVQVIRKIRHTLFPAVRS